MAFLYPRISIARTSELAEELTNVTVGDAIRTSSLRDNQAIFGATGGQRVPESRIASIQKKIRELASKFGYPDSVSIERSRINVFDAEVSVVLIQDAEMAPSEASRTDVWSFFSTVVLPDLVRWRFPGGASGTSLERFGGNGGVVRNTFGRLWWRGWTFGASTSDGELVLRDLGEDEIVQIMERSSIAGYPPLAVSLGSAVIQHAASAPRSVARSELMRESAKRIQRLRSIISFESLSREELDKLVSNSVAATQFAMTDGAFGSAEKRPDLVETDIPGEQASIAAQEINDVAQLVNHIQSIGLEFRDRTWAGGNLWIIAGLEIQDEIDRLAESGYDFVFLSAGGRGTGHRPAWLLRSSSSH